MCTTFIFSVDGRKCLAENYDYILDHGLVGVSLIGTRKSNGEMSADQVVEWVVKFGSVTFNQLSLEMPVSGMNEVGLVVALMWHEEGDYGTDNRYRRLNSLQWIQFQLDNYATVDQVIGGLQSIRPDQGPVPLHFTILDASGDSLIVEFIDGELVLHKNLDYPILTNTSYDISLTTAKKTPGNADQSLGNSIGRFAHLYNLIANGKNAVDVSGGFHLLDTVSQTSNVDGVESFPWANHANDTVTAWSVVLDPVRRLVALKTNRNSSIREFHLDQIDFEADEDRQVMDINVGTSGPALAFFEPYSKDKNLEILRLSAPAIGLPYDVIHEISNTVDSMYRKHQMI